MPKLYNSSIIYSSDYKPLESTIISKYPELVGKRSYFRKDTIRNIFRDFVDKHQNHFPDAAAILEEAAGILGVDIKSARQTPTK